MDAIKFHKELIRMTQKCKIYCECCPLESVKDCKRSEDAEALVKIVAKWSIEHPEVKPCPFSEANLLLMLLILDLK